MEATDAQHAPQAQPYKRQTVSRKPSSTKLPLAKNYSHNTTARILLLRLRVKHLARSTKIITLGNQLIHLLPALEHALHRLMQHLLRRIELVLDLQNLVRLLRVLVLRDVVFEFGVGERVCGCAVDGGLGVLGGELVAEFFEDAGDDEVGVFFVGDDDAAEAS